MLNHVIKDEKSYLESLLLGGAEARWDDLSAQTLDKA